MTLDDAQQLIEAAYERRQELSASNIDAATGAAIEHAIEALDTGACRVAEPIAGRWQVHAWLKKAVLLYFRTHENTVIDAGYTRFFDKVPLKYAAADAAAIRAAGRARGAARARASRRLRGAECGVDAPLREHRRLRRRRHHGRHLGDRGLVRADRPQRASVRRGRHRRRARTVAGRTRRSSRTTASSARAPRSSRAW